MDKVRLRGRAHGIVVATGVDTAVGRLAESMSSVHAGKPPLTERMARFSRTIAIVVLMAAVLIALRLLCPRDTAIG